MEQKRRREIAVMLIISITRQKRFGFEPWDILERRLKTISEEIGLSSGSIVLINFSKDLLSYLHMLSFRPHFNEEKITEQFNLLMTSASLDEVALTLLKHSLAKEGVQLKFNKRRLNEEAQKIGISPEEFTTFLNPLMHEIVDIVVQ